MALTLQSLAAAARRRAQRAHLHVEKAQHELASANAQLDEAIASGDVERTREAHECTMEAERAAEEAAEELGVVEELLSEGSAPQAAPARTEKSGEGVRSLVETLRPARKQ